MLNEISSQACLGLDLVYDSIYVEEIVSSACEILGLDPLYVANEGVFIAVTDNSIADKVVEMLRGYEYCNKASLIGHFTSDHPGKVLMQNDIGGRRVINMLAGEQLPRIC